MQTSHSLAFHRLGFQPLRGAWFSAESGQLSHRVHSVYLSLLAPDVFFLCDNMGLSRELTASPTGVQPGNGGNLMLVCVNLGSVGAAWKRWILHPAPPKAHFSWPSREFFPLTVSLPRCHLLTSALFSSLPVPVFLPGITFANTVIA